MRLNVALGLMLVSSVLALPRSHLLEKVEVSSLEGSGRDSEASWYGRLLVIASVALDRTIMPYMTSQSILSPALGTTCIPGFSFNPHTMACEHPERSLPIPSHPDGHGKCSDGQFWFGPKQTCIGGQDETTEPPVGYYCPPNWSFSAKHRCCVPDTPAAIMRNSCRNGNGTWDLIRIACAERTANFTD